MTYAGQTLRDQHVVCKHHKITEGSVTIGCDGMNSLRHTSSNWTPDVSKNDYDLVMAARSLMRKCPVTWNFRHIPGHQDKNRRAVLDDWAKLNIQVNDAAIQYREEYDEPRRYIVAREPWAL